MKLFLLLLGENHFLYDSRFLNHGGKTPLLFRHCAQEYSSAQLFSSFTHYRWNVAISGKVDIQVDLAGEFIISVSTSLSVNGPLDIVKMLDTFTRVNILLNIKATALWKKGCWTDT